MTTMQTDLFGFSRAVPKMPIEYMGETKNNGGYTKHNPRQWTSEEIAWCINLRDKGYTTEQIADSVGRDKVCVGIKMKRIKKSEYNYNAPHVKEKYRYNEAFVKRISPSSVLDVYAGQKSWYEGKVEVVVSNDINPEAITTTHIDALRCLCAQWAEEGGAEYDIVDLDPFGSAYDCFDLAVKMARKGLVVTFGELGHKRWKRLDFVSRYYGIEALTEFTLENLIKEIQKIGMRNKKKLTPVFAKEWQNIGRVWFDVEKVKII